jgi:hypothetical protein
MYLRIQPSIQILRGLLDHNGLELLHRESQQLRLRFRRSEFMKRENARKMRRQLSRFRRWGDCVLKWDDQVVRAAAGNELVGVTTAQSRVNRAHNLLDLKVLEWGECFGSIDSRVCKEK